MKKIIIFILTSICSNVYSVNYNYYIPNYIKSSQTFNSPVYNYDYYLYPNTYHYTFASVYNTGGVYYIRPYFSVSNNPYNWQAGSAYSQFVMFDIGYYTVDAGGGDNFNFWLGYGTIVGDDQPPPFNPANQPDTTGTPELPDAPPTPDPPQDDPETDYTPGTQTSSTADEENPTLTSFEAPILEFGDLFSNLKNSVYGVFGAVSDLAGSIQGVLSDIRAKYVPSVTQKKYFFVWIPAGEYFGNTFSEQKIDWSDHTDFCDKCRNLFEWLLYALYVFVAYNVTKGLIK